MSELRVCKALLWKELRSWWSIVLTIFVLFPILAYAETASPGLAFLRVLRSLTPIIFIMSIVLWGASKAANENGSKEFADTNLPVRPCIRWLVSFALPALVAGMLGIWFCCSRAYISESGGAYTEAVKEGSILSILAFTIAWLLAEVVTKWMAVLVGLVLAVIFKDMLERDVPNSMLFYRDISILLAGFTVGSFLFNVILRKYPTRISKVAAFMMPALVIVIMVATGTGRNKDWQKAGWYGYYKPYRIDSMDWSKYVTPQVSSESLLTLTLNYGNYRTRTFVSRKFDNAVAPVDFLGEDRVCLVQQMPHKRYTSVLIWNVQSGRIKSVARLDTGRFMLISGGGPYSRGFIRPDGRYLVLTLLSESGNGRGLNLWVVDLVKGDSKIALPNAEFASDSIRWVGENALLYGHGRPVKVDLASCTGQLASTEILE